MKNDSTISRFREKAAFPSIKFVGSINLEMVEVDGEIKGEIAGRAPVSPLSSLLLRQLRLPMAPIALPVSTLDLSSGAGSIVFGSIQTVVILGTFIVATNRAFHRYLLGEDQRWLDSLPNHTIPTINQLRRIRRSEPAPLEADAHPGSQSTAPTSAQSANALNLQSVNPTPILANPSNVDAKQDNSNGLRPIDLSDAIEQYVYIPSFLSRLIIIIVSCRWSISRARSEIALIPAWRPFFRSKVVYQAKRDMIALRKRVKVGSFPRELVITPPDKTQDIERRYEERSGQRSVDLGPLPTTDP